MIQHLTIDDATHEAVTTAARDARMPYDQMLTWIVYDWATTWRGRQQARLEFVQALEDACGVLRGDD